MREQLKDPGNKGSLTWRKMENYNTGKKWIKRKNGQILLTEMFRVDSRQVENNAKWGKGTKYSGKFSMLIGVVEAVIFVQTLVIVCTVSCPQTNRTWSRDILRRSMSLLAGHPRAAIPGLHSVGHHLSHHPGLCDTAVLLKDLCCYSKKQHRELQSAIFTDYLQYLLVCGWMIPWFEGRK